MEYYKGINHAYSINEQRIGWLIDDTYLAKDIKALANGQLGGGQQLRAETILQQQPIESMSGVLPCDTYSVLRFLLKTEGKATIGLQGFDGSSWFYFHNRPFNFLEQGDYSIIVSPVLALQARIVLLEGGPIWASIIAK